MHVWKETKPCVTSQHNGYKHLYMQILQVWLHFRKADVTNSKNCRSLTPETLGKIHTSSKYYVVSEMLKTAKETTSEWRAWDCEKMTASILGSIHTSFGENLGKR